MDSSQSEGQTEHGYSYLNGEEMYYLAVLGVKGLEVQRGVCDDWTPSVYSLDYYPIPAPMPVNRLDYYKKYGKDFKYRIKVE